MTNPKTAYAFGDSSLAAQRLVLLASTFEESSRAFMLQSVETPPRRVADLGCGPGYSTHLLADTLKPGHTVGLDNSESFLAYARTTANDELSFHHHDIATAPFPDGPFDLIFDRFLLTHLPDPEAAIALWTGQLRPRGLLLIEEVEHIDTNNPTFRAYLDIQQRMLKHQGNDLFIGPRLDGAAGPEGTRRRASSVRSVQVSASRAARMFHMNLHESRRRDFVREHWGSVTLDRMERDLDAIARGDINTPPVEWGLRQIVMERVGP